MPTCGIVHYKFIAPSARRRVPSYIRQKNSPRTKNCPRTDTHCAPTDENGRGTDRSLCPMRTSDRRLKDVTDMKPGDRRTKRHFSGANRSYETATKNSRTAPKKCIHRLHFHYSYWNKNFTRPPHPKLIQGNPGLIPQKTQPSNTAPIIPDSGFQNSLPCHLTR